MKFDVRQTNFVPHPAGVYTGIITDVTDQGERESSFEGKTRLVHKISINIESYTATMDDGNAFVHKEWCTLSSDDRSKLVKLRQALLGRPLTEAERKSFDDDAEMVGRRVHYVIEHTYRNGKTFASIASWSLLSQTSAGPGASRQPVVNEGRDEDTNAEVDGAVEGDSALTESDLPL
ncbi:MAG: hypothetical protein O3A47_08555 [Chloroflexi bacterium]|nr:hypothetical protein [Chloroflexota bacterium]